MRSNPHAADVAPNSEQTRVPMARIDPRQRGLFAAAWAVGAVAATLGQGVSSLALAAPVGAFGLIYRRAAWPQPFYDERSAAAVYPVFHVVRALLRLAAAPRWLIRGLPPGVVGVAARSGEVSALILANLGQACCRLDLPRRGTVRRLDQDNVDSAIMDADWLCAAPSDRRSWVTLEPFNVVFVDWPELEA
jgi:D-apionolactonase